MQIEPSVASFLIGQMYTEIMVVARNLRRRLGEPITQVYNIAHLQNDKGSFQNGGRGWNFVWYWNYLCPANFVWWLLTQEQK